MKKAITYREITVAIGILVAMVIALTLWINTQGGKISEAGAQRHISLPMIVVGKQITQYLHDVSFEFSPQGR